MFLFKMFFCLIPHPVFGDSGNASPLFTISGPSVGDSSGSTTSPGLVASPSTQSSYTELAPPPSASTTASSFAPLLLVTPTSASDPSAPALTSSRLPAASQAGSSDGHSTLSTSSSRETGSSSASTTSVSPAAGSNSNNALPRIQNPSAMIAGGVITVFTIFFL